jgi:hypothetical protein
MHSNTVTPIFHQIARINYIVVDILSFIEYERKTFKDYEESIDSDIFEKIEQFHNSIDIAWFHINFKFHDLRKELNTLKKIYKTDADAIEIIKIVNKLDIQQTMHKISNINAFITTISTRINVSINSTQAKQIYMEIQEKTKNIFPLNNDERLLETNIDKLHQKMVQILDKMYLKLIT